MHKRIGTLGTIAVLLAAVGLIAAQSIASADSKVRTVRLSGANELDPTTLEPGAGDPDGSGRAKVRVGRRGWDRLLHGVLAGHRLTDDGPHPRRKRL